MAIRAPDGANNSLPNIQLKSMKRESCWKLYNIQSNDSIMVIGSVQISIIAQMGLDGRGTCESLPRFFVALFIHAQMDNFSF